MTAVELLTVTPDPGSRATAWPLARLFEQAGARVRGHRVVASDESEVEAALRDAVAASAISKERSNMVVFALPWDRLPACHSALTIQRSLAVFQNTILVGIAMTGWKPVPRQVSD